MVYALPVPLPCAEQNLYHLSGRSLNRISGKVVLSRGDNHCAPSECCIDDGELPWELMTPHFGRHGNRVTLRCGLRIVEMT